MYFNLIPTQTVYKISFVYMQTHQYTLQKKKITSVVKIKISSW